MRAVRWWDFDTLYLLNNLARLQALCTDTETPHRYRQPTPRLAWRLTDDKFKLIGFDDGTFRPLDEAPAKLRDYLAQCTRQGPLNFSLARGCVELTFGSPLAGVTAVEVPIVSLLAPPALCAAVTLVCGL